MTDMTYKQVEALRLMIRKETLAAVLEGESMLDMRSQRLTQRDIDRRIEQLRRDAEQHGREVIE
jgi:predicted Holliday junction resolvase-like endonuclease